MLTRVCRSGGTHPPTGDGQRCDDHTGIPPDRSLLPDTRSELALPMIVGEDVLGVFDVQHDRVDAFTPVYQDVLFALSGQIATALQNARYVERIAQSLKETQIRLTITQALGEAQTVRAVIDTVMNHGDAPEGVSALLALAEGDLGRAGFRAVAIYLPIARLGDANQMLCFWRCATCRTSSICLQATASQYAVWIR